MNPYDLNDVSKEMNKKHKQKEVKKEYCEWKYIIDKNIYYWESGCKKTLRSKDREFKYCPYCGKEIKDLKNE